MLKKYYLGGFFWAPIPHKRYQNTYGFAGEVYTDISHFTDDIACTLKGNRFQKHLP